MGITWTADGGRRTTDDGRWTMDDGRGVLALIRIAFLDRQSRPFNEGINVLATGYP